MTRAPDHATRAVTTSMWWECQVLLALFSSDVARLVYLVDLADAQVRAA